MVEEIAASALRRASWARKHPVITYFVFTFLISWGGVLLVVAPRLLRGESISKFTGLMLFPVLLTGPLITGLGMTAYVSGLQGIRDIFRGVGKVRIGVLWYAILLLPPLVILAVLTVLRTFVSASFAPNWFLPGLAFGIAAGFIEELGWTGFAFPAMARKLPAFWASIILSGLWVAWHLPVVDFLGAASPHGHAWLYYFLGFGAAMSAIRVLICWAYANTRSLFLAQLMHMVSTGSLVAFGPPRVTPGEEAFWYGSYGIALWLVVITVIIVSRRCLGMPFAMHRSSAGGRPTPMHKPLAQPAGDITSV